MAKFITLTVDNADEEIIVNVDKIIKFYRGKLTYAVVEVEGDKGNLLVKETPHQIMGKLA
jgi:hypothetical protein